MMNLNKIKKYYTTLTFLAVFLFQSSLMAEEYVPMMLDGIQMETVVIYQTILVYLDKRGAFVGSRLGQYFDQVLGIVIDGTGDEGCLSAQRQGQGLEGAINRAHRRRLGLHANAGGGRILPFSQAIYAIVEQDDVQIDVSPAGVN